MKIERKIELCKFGLFINDLAAIILVIIIIVATICYTITSPRLKAYDQSRCLGYGLNEECK